MAITLNGNGIVTGVSDLPTAVTATNLELSGGIYLGGTGSANYLDDYEEGTWTPTRIASIGYTGMTALTSVNGDYTKIGDTVFINLDFETDSTATTLAVGDHILISAVPFTPRDLSGSGGIVYLVGTATIYESIGSSTWAVGHVWVNALNSELYIVWNTVSGSVDADREHSLVIQYKTDS